MWSWFHKKEPPHFPKPKGPFAPGCMDVMLEYSASGVFVRLYYPTKTKPEASNHSKWIPWFVDDNYLVGLARAFWVSPMAFRLIRWWYSASNIHIPTLYGEKVNTDNKLKCVILSHGYVGTRFTYSNICNELASRGYLVAAIEHRDGSTPYTYYYKTKEDAVKDERTLIHTKKIFFFRGYYEIANPQVHQRTSECCKLFDFLINLNNGVVPHNIMNDVKSNKEVDFKLEDLVGQLDTENMAIAGHSFGGATVFVALSKRKELKQGILLDPWMFPIKAEEHLIDHVTQPLLFINTQTFHTPTSIIRMEKFLTNEQRQMFTILHTTHENQTDSVFIFGYWLNWFMKKLNPHVAWNINNALMLQFLKEHTGHTENIDDCELFLSEQGENIASGLTKLWA